MKDTNVYGLIGLNVTIGAAFGFVFESIFWGIVLALVPMPVNLALAAGVALVRFMG